MTTKRTPDLGLRTLDFGTSEGFHHMARLVADFRPGSEVRGLKSGVRSPKSESDVRQFFPRLRALCVYDGCVRHKIRFLWNATKGHRLAPWRSPYLLWRIETYTGVKMTQIGFVEFWEFMWRERVELWRFLKWTSETERYVHPKPKGS